MIRKLTSLVIVLCMTLTMLPSVASAAGGPVFDMRTGAVTIEDGTEDGTLKITQDGGEEMDNIPASTVINLTQTGAGTTANRIIVKAHVPDGVNIRLDGVNIQVGNAPFEITADAGRVSLILADGSSNKLISTSNNYAGLQKMNTGKEEDGLLTISCESASLTHECDENCGELIAECLGFFSAGIGGGQNFGGYDIEIYGGHIIANGGKFGGAGIGGGYGGAGSGIHIYGGNIEATGGRGAGIGGGYDASGKKITISGGIVHATGNNGGAGIGGGSRAGSGEDITISGGLVTATGDNGGAGIGGGVGYSGTTTNYGGDAKNITISGGTVIAQAQTTGDHLGSGIGSGGLSGRTGACSNLVITGGNIYTSRMGTTPVNGSGTPVYKATFTIPGDTTGSTTIDAISVKVDNIPYEYNITDAKSILVNGEGKLFVYLPFGNSRIEYEGKTYAAFVNSLGTARFKELVLFAITIATPPARAYKYGETFSKEDIVVQATYNNGSTDENFTDYTVDKTGPLTMSDTVITLTANENAEIQTMLNITVDKADVINSGGSATVAYTGASYDLEMIDGLFTVDPYAGEPTYSIEEGGTGEGTISGSILTVIKTGTFVIGLETAETENYAAGPKVTATLTVNKGAQPGTPGSGNGGSGGSSPATPVPAITVSEVSSELFGNHAKDIHAEADTEGAFGQSVEVRITDSTEAQNELFSLAVAGDEVYPFDISLHSEKTGEKVQPREGYSVKITLPVPEKLLDAKERIRVIYSRDGKVEVLSSQLVEKDGKWYITFEAVHFSPYALVVSPEPVKTWVNPFIDVREDDWFFSAVRFVAQNGLMNGTGKNTFSPRMATNRGMIVSILYKLSGSEETSQSTFRDVAPGAYYANGVAWAQKNGIIAGYGNGLFGPEDSITREQMATILWKYAGSPAAATTSLDAFQDAGEITAYAKTAMAWACESGIMAGKGNGILDPRGIAARAESAKIIESFLKVLIDK